MSEADLLGHELAEHDREQREQDGHEDESKAVGRGDVERREGPEPAAHLVDEADRRERRCQEAQEVDADLDDGEEAAGVRLEVLDADRGPLALVDQLLDPAATERDQGDLGRREHAVEQHEDDDEREFEDGAGHEAASPEAGSDGAPGAPGSAAASAAVLASAAGFARGSRMRAGTPTASLPAGTSFVTTDPAPVRAPSPMLRGATIIVSTPRKAPSPMVVGCLVVPS